MASEPQEAFCDDDWKRRDRAALHASRAAEPDDYLSVLDDDGDLAAAGEGDHPVELLLVGFDVDVDEGDPALRVVLTGRGRVGSRVLAEDLDAVRFHGSLLAGECTMRML
jgi:hypothetical protein